MKATAPQEPPSPGLPPDTPRAAGWTRLLTLLGLFVAYFRFPRPGEPYSGIYLDVSWQMALEHFFLSGHQFGRDVVFTFGPLGHLVSGGLLTAWLLGWQLILTAVQALTVVKLGADRPWPVRAVLYLLPVVVTAISPTVAHLMLIALVGACVLRSTVAPQLRADHIGHMLFLALLAGTKFTSFLMIAFTVGIICLQAALARRYRRSLVLAAVFAGGFAVIWRLCGQDLANLPKYWSNSLEIALGYGPAMNTPAPPALLVLGIGALGLLVACIGLRVVLSAQKLPGLAEACLLSGCTYLSWKHSFTRADFGHLGGFFVMPLLLIATLPRFSDVRCAIRLHHISLSLVSLLCLAAWMTPSLRSTLLPALRLALEDSVPSCAVSDPRSRHREKVADINRHFDLPRIRTTVGSAPVDLLGYDQAAIFANDLNYRPRPIFQSYSAYTPKLAGINLKFIESDRAPHFMLQKFDTMDGRLPMLDDAPVMAILGRHYRFLFEERGFALWQLRTNRPPLMELMFEPVQVVRTTFNTPVSLPVAGDNQAVWVSVHWQPSLTGRIRSALYQESIVFLQVESAPDVRALHRLPRKQAEHGFVVSPVVSTQEEFIRFATEGTGNRAKAISLTIPAKDATRFESGVEFRFSTLKAF